MNILICSATELEIKPLINLTTNNNFDILISGVGAFSTCFELSKALATKKYDFVINIGIAGSFSKIIKINDLVEVTSDCFGDFGINSSEKFVPMHQTEFYNNSTFGTDGKITNSSITTDITKVRATTVNSCTGTEKRATELIKLFSPEIETMEGAAFFYSCKKSNIKCTQIRCISNYIEDRDKSKWQIESAVKKLNKYVLELVNKLEKQ